MGSKESAWQTVMEELGGQADQNLFLHSKHYQLDRVLDLTDPGTRKVLGITGNMLTETMLTGMTDKNLYELTHQLGGGSPIYSEFTT